MNLKYFLVLLLVSVILISGCTQDQQPKSTDTDSVSPGATNTDSGSSGIKEFSLTAKRFEFTPSTITVKKGDHVKLKITALDFSHGFALPDFGVAKQLEQGKETVVEFTASRAGTFTFFCNIFCGAGHTDMKGQLIVEE